MKLARFKALSFEKRRVGRGFTLVELIVVIAIIAILAAVGVVIVIGYVNHSKFNKNEQNAITVYQTSQTAMSQMTSAGTMDSWIRDIIADDTITRITALQPIEEPEANESIGKTVYLTYNPKMPNNESKVVYDLLSGYFYDQTIFNGTISIEFYISITYDANSNYYYSARVISAFYSLENTASIGWDEKCLNGSADGLPDRDPVTRYKTTFVGYFDGSEASAKPPVVSVFLPRTQTYVIDGHIVGPTVDPDADSYGYLFNLRNGETLDVSWALFDEDGKLHTDHAEDFTIKLITEADSDRGNGESYDDIILTIKDTDIQAVRFINDDAKVFESVGNYAIERVSASGLITIDVQIGSESPKAMTFPITRTVVSNDGRTGCPKDPAFSTAETPADYYEYRLSIDCMMIRSNESVEEENRYNIKRMFGDTPHNFYAVIEGSFGYYANGSTTTTTRIIPETYAARAIDDPVFLVDVKSVNGNTSYVYKVDSHLAAFDDNDGMDPSTGDFITGICYVNTLFGDYKYSNSLAGTSWTTEGGDAVITEFRHLYNIRNVDSDYISNFRIVRDLNWYVDKSGLRYVSEVRLFKYVSPLNYSSPNYSSPASNSSTINEIYTVPFPAFNTLSANQTLEAMSGKNGTVYSINNLQLRKSSFNIEDDSAYGLICTNLGKIGNLRTNNLSLVMANVDDKTNDLDSIYTDSISVYQQSTDSESGNLPKDNNKPIGGLVGVNAGTGNVGNDSSTIIMSNSIVMANDYWKYFDKANKTATGGIIGQNDSQVLGSIEINGSFAVVGRDCVGGIIGKSTNDIGARLLVNISKAPSSRYTLPSYSYDTFTTQHLSCVIICKNNVGGAIGLLDGADLLYDVDDPFTYSRNPENGVFAGVSNDDYQIDVNLPDNSLIVEVGKFNNLKEPLDKYSSAGGAIGFMKECGGTTASIRVNNAGSIIVLDTEFHVYCGGAIGRDYNCSTENVYINVNNGGGRLGYINDTTGPVASGGAIGQINSNEENRKIVINAVNNGTIIARGNKNGQGVGGAIGGALYGSNITFIINVENKNNSVIKDTVANEGNNSGVGGAIGCVGVVNTVPQFSAETVIYSENHGYIEGVHHVGGAVGFAPINRGKIFAVDSGTITGSQHYVGGAVGRLSYGHYGVVQATLDSSCEISGYRYVGGAVGRLTEFHDGATVRTVVTGSSSITGQGSLIGGICGDLRLVGTGSGSKIELVGDSSDPVLTVKGNEGVGGAIGLMRSEEVNSTTIVTPEQSSTNKLAVQVAGTNFIGGVVGCLKESTNAAEETDMTKLLGTTSVVLNNYMITIRAKLNPKSYVYGSGNNVGGAVGYIAGKFDNGNYSTFGGIIDVSTSSGSTSGLAYIRGNKFVGGAVGHIESVVPARSANAENGYIKADFSAATWDIEATVAAGNEADVGGAVGYFQGATDKKYGVNDSTYPVSANLGSTNVTASGYNVGGAIGRNQVRTGIVTANNVAGTVSGQYNVGGAIGCNDYQFSSVEATITSSGRVIATGVNPSTTYRANGSNVGGAVGYYAFSANDNATITSLIKATVSGTIKGSGNNVGGAVGYLYSNKKTHLIRNVSAILHGAASVEGADNVGGAIGFSLSNITNITTNISGTSGVIGSTRVGGAIGWTYAVEQASGANVLSEAKNITNLSFADLEKALGSGLYQSSGRIASIVSTISADYALQGDTYIGGAVGQSGWKTVIGGNKYASPALVSVEAIVNSGYLFDPFETGDPDGKACVGGVIGLVVDGRINGVKLSGTGGTVSTDKNYPCPEISMSGAVLIAASGQSVGGVIGQIGLESTATESFTGNSAQNVTVSNISAADTIKLCVVSMNGSERIGGWIGSSFGKYGGIGNRASGDYDKESSRAVYNVNNVRYVYSEGDYVGGFCGYAKGYGTARETWVLINVNLTKATITGRNGVGGAFGLIHSVYFKKGAINVSLNDHSVIGDRETQSICQEAGGAVGNLNLIKEENKDVKLEIPINVTIDATSNIWSNGGDPDTSDYGVGGIFGRAYGIFTAAGTVRVTALDPKSVSIYSRYSNVGGVVGVMDSVNMSAYTSSARSYAVNVSVSSDGDNACAGGFVGRINSLSNNMYYCYCYGDVSVKANGTKACTGGFVGYAMLASDTYKIENSYTTATVSSSGEYTGGFIGRFLRGTISNCYVGGHTYQGRYVAGEGNVTGKGNVGGFAGAKTGAGGATFSNCYSTASVLGTADNIGGFIGASSTTIKVEKCYCTGKVISPNTLTSGAFAGDIGNVAPANYSGNKAMRDVNAGNFPLYGQSSSSAITATNIDYADDTSIKGTNKHAAHPFDESLPDVYGLRAVIGSEHYGDWPLPNSGTTIDDAEIQILTQIGEDEQGNPEYGWVVFENNKYEYVFNGTTVTIDPTKLKVLVQGVPLELDTDYVIYYRDNSKVGTATITFAAKSGSTYSGAISKTFKIIAADIEGITVEFNETTHEYSGARIIPDVTVKYNDVKLVYGTDYTLAYDRDGNIEDGFDNDNINIGDMYVYVIGKGSYAGTKLIGQYEITHIDLSKLKDEDIDLIGADNLVYDEIEGVAVKHCPNVAVRYNGQTLNGTTDPDDTSADYVITYENNDVAGTAYLVITGTGSVYTGTKKVEFTILPAINTWITDPTISGWIYGETPNAPTGRVKYGEIDYKFFYDANCNNPVADISAVDVGRYYVQVFAKDPDGHSNFTGPTPVILNFTISPMDISETSVSIIPAEYKYNGAPIDIDKSKITVTVGTGDSAYVLEQDDFTIVSYDPSEHTEPGLVTITVAGVGNYEGTATGTYTIYREYEIKFMNNGQLFTKADVREGNTVSNPGTPQAPASGNYRFGGWYTDLAYTDKYDFSEPVTSEFPLYARWIRVNYITYITGDPDVVIAGDNPQEVDYGTYAERPADPMRSGYVFGGWYQNSDCTGTPYAFNVNVYSDTTLYAKWTPEYKVDFDTGEGTPIDSQFVIENGVLTEPVEPQWDGHTFLGWYSDDACTIPYVFTDQVKKSFTLYAKWGDPPDGG